MSRYLHFLLAFAHLLITWKIIERCMNMHLPGSSFLIWLILCWTAAWWRPPIVRLFMNIRKPFADERRILLPILSDLCQQTGGLRKYRLLIDETPGIGASAFGTRSIIINKDALKHLDTEQLGGLLAHEMGHLQSHDTIPLYCVATGSYLPMNLYLFLCRHRAVKWLLVCIIIIAAAVVLFATSIAPNSSLIIRIARAIVTLAVLICWNLVFALIYKTNDRYIEYRQDAYANACGYGDGILKVLKLCITEPYSDVRPWNVIFFGSHPLIHNRIIRLEELQEST